MKKKGVIEYNRLDIKIVDVKALNKQSFECHMALKDKDDRLLS